MPLYVPGSGGGGGAVDSVNGETGTVVLDAGDVGAAAVSHAHPVADITATGTPSAATFLRGDGVWTTGGGGYDTIQKDGSTATLRTVVNFIGDGVTVADDGAFSRTTVEIASSGGGPTTVNVQTGTTYTFVLADAANTMVRAGNAGAQTYTIPPNSSVDYDVGATLEAMRYGAGTLTFVAGGGVTLRTPAAATARARYSTISAFQVATDEWVLGGDLG